MKYVRRILLVLLVLITVPSTGIIAIGYSHAELSTLPELESGDLIFQTAITNQTPAIVFATGSTYSHVGIIRKQGNRISVIHAGQQVMESSLEDFIKGGWGEQYTILRYSTLTPEQREAIAATAIHYLGRPYNYVFHMGDNSVYCSQLPYLAFQDAGVTLEGIQKIADLHMDNFAVKKLFNERWKIHPSCQAPDMTAERCWKTIMEEPIITPVGLTHDSHLTLVHSNYWY